MEESSKPNDGQINSISDEQIIPRNKIIFRNSIVLTLIFIVALLITHIFRGQLMEKNNLIAISQFTLLLVFIVITQYQVREKTFGGKMSFAESFSSGFRLCLYVALMYGIFALLFYALIAPEVKDEMLQNGAQQMREKGMTDEQIATGQKITGFFLSPVGIFLGSFLGYTIFGAILSLISSLFTARQR